MIYNDSIIIQFKDNTRILTKEFIRFGKAKEVYVHTIGEGETLFSMANHYYGDTRMWYLIPEYNSEIIDDIFDLTVGMEIQIPLF